MGIIQEYKNKGKVSREALENATEPELLELQEMVNNDITSITNQLDQAKAALITKGEYADPNWYQKAKGAKRIKGRLSQVIQNVLHQRRLERHELAQQEKAQRGDSHLKLLLQAIEFTLSDEEKTKVLDMWEELRS